MIAVGVLLAALYGGGVRRLGRRGRPWPPVRSIAFGAGVAALAASEVVSESSFVGHMVGHVLLGMAAPLLLALGAPVTLALQSVSRPAKRRLLRALHSSPVRLLAHPVVGFAVWGVTLVALYLSPLFSLTLRDPALHAAVHLHFLLAGGLFLWPLVGVDPLPRRPAHGARVLAVLAAVPFHAFLGMVLLSAPRPLAPTVYPSLADQQAAAGVLWASGELLTLVAAVIVLRAWMVADGRDAARADRRLNARVASPPSLPLVESHPPQGGASTTHAPGMRPGQD